MSVQATPKKSFQTKKKSKNKKSNWPRGFADAVLGTAYLLLLFLLLLENFFEFHEKSGQRKNLRQCRAAGPRN